MGVMVGVMVGVMEGVGVGEGSGSTGPGPATMLPLVLITFDEEKNSIFFLFTSKKLGILAILLFINVYLYIM